MLRKRPQKMKIKSLILTGLALTVLTGCTVVTAPKKDRPRMSDRHTMIKKAEKVPGMRGPLENRAHKASMARKAPMARKAASTCNCHDKASPSKKKMERPEGRGRDRGSRPDYDAMRSRIGEAMKRWEIDRDS